MPSTTPQTLSASDPVRCPHCHASQEGAAEDYVVPGRIGPASRFLERCTECEGRFHVECTPEGRYIVAKA